MEYCFGAILKIFTVCIVIDIYKNNRNNKHDRCQNKL